MSHAFLAELKDKYPSAIGRKRNSIIKIYILKFKNTKRVLFIMHHFPTPTDRKIRICAGRCVVVGLIDYQLTRDIGPNIQPKSPQGISLFDIMANDRDANAAARAAGLDVDAVVKYSGLSKKMVFDAAEIFRRHDEGKQLSPQEKLFVEKTLSRIPKDEMPTFYKRMVSISAVDKINEKIAQTIVAELNTPEKGQAFVHHMEDVGDLKAKGITRLDGSYVTIKKMTPSDLKSYLRNKLTDVDEAYKFKTRIGDKVKIFSRALQAVESEDQNLGQGFTERLGNALKKGKNLKPLATDSIEGKLTTFFNSKGGLVRTSVGAMFVGFWAGAQAAEVTHSGSRTSRPAAPAEFGAQDWAESSK